MTTSPYARLWEASFDQSGFRSKLIGSASEFLQFELPDVASCLVLDVRLPGLSGLDFQAEMARTNTYIPIIFMTGHGDIPMSVRAMKAGAVEFLTKPFRDQDMLDAVQLALTRDHVRREKERATFALKAKLDTLTNARTGGDGTRHLRSHEQADCCPDRGQRDHGEGPSRQRHAKDGRAIIGRLVRMADILSIQKAGKPNT